MILNPRERYLLLDGSGLRAWRECPQRAWCSLVAGGERTPDFKGGFVSRFATPALLAGSTVHKALEYRYRVCKGSAPTPEVRAEMARIALTSWEGQEFAPDYGAKTPEWRTPERVADLLAAYNDAYGEEPFVVREVEAPFARRLGEIRRPEGVWAVLWQGRRDLTVAFRGTTGEEWVMDHKTSSADGENPLRSWQRNPSQLGYVWSRQALTGREPEGFIMNRLIWRKPLAEKSTRRDSKPRNAFDRTPIPVPQWMLDEWREATLVGAAGIIECHQSGVWPPTGADCQFCRYFDVCTARPQDRLRLLESGAQYAPNTWSPLKEEA